VAAQERLFLIFQNAATKKNKKEVKRNECKMEEIFKKLNRFFYGNWQLAVLDLKRGRWIKEADIANLPYLKAENANGRHILMQPLKKLQYYYLMVDDVDWLLIKAQHKLEDGSWKPGRMVIETSPANFQVWIHCDRALCLDEKRYWLKKLRNDPGADPNNRWGRCPGFRNRKKKHGDGYGRYPLCKLFWVDWMGLAKIPKTLSHQPRGGVCQNSNLSRVDYLRDDESSTDFAYALALIRKGFRDDEIAQRLIKERSNWQNHAGHKRKQQYLNRTINSARSFIDGKNN